MAVISDIHGNLAALEAVLQSIRHHHITEIRCTGDIVGYGARPRECLEIVMHEAKKTVLGNHDQAVLFDPENFNEAALVSANWTRAQLEGARNSKYMDFLGELPIRAVEEGRVFVHASPRDPVNEYVTPGDVYETAKMKACFKKVESISLQGHTHIPGVFEDGASPSFTAPHKFEEMTFKFDRGTKYMVNVGSVGQPRDTDPRACYAIVDEDTVRWVRVEYDVEKTINEILTVPKLNKMIAFRLRSGV